MERVNVELKARDPDPEATAGRCRALGAEDRGVLHQRDTYFAGARGRLKLREQGSKGSQLIAYRRPDATEPEASRYVLAAVHEPEPVREALASALGTTVVVTKLRRLFMWENVRIHLDDVEGLGAFVELEALVGPGLNDPEEARAKVARLREELAIEDGALIAAGYSDLLLDGPGALLEAAQAVMENAYAPYSQLKVGAAVRGRSGAIYTGANVENAAYPQGQCAEASALGALVAAGESAIAAVAVVASHGRQCPPCGGCRQRLSEFGEPGTPVYLRAAPGEPHAATTLGELLPRSFGAEALEE
ncbi:MAG TPA: cytidine deaminase [Solirubrobacteraceae bacterium]|nr:cytidine deaminase [Solirubrobacteraceae bacterium]